MRRTILILSMILAPSFSHAQTQPTLQPWTQVFGTVNGQDLGGNVTGIKPTANLPYRVAVSHGGMTSFYRLSNPTDTAAQLTIRGTNLLLGDLNNDGLTDAVVSKTVNGYDTVLVYWGTASGLDTNNALRIPGENQYDGFRPSCIGDLNNDGKPDLVLWAGSFPYPYSRGKLYVYLNPVAGIIPNATIIGDTTESGLGVNCVVADLNNDGFQDMVVRGWNQLGPMNGRYDYVNIYWGVGKDTVNTASSTQLRSGQFIGSAGLACFDVNGDGIADLLWTHGDTGSTNDIYKIFVHLGGANFSPIPSLNLLNPGVANFGNTIVNAGDMNGDGYDDIVVGAYDATITSGFVFVYGGGPRIDGTFDAAVGLSSESYFGYSITSVGDINGDGLSDIIVGAPAYDFETNKGYWGIFLGDSAIHVTGVHDKPSTPSIFRLYQCYPNPFNPQTTIKYELKQGAQVTLEITNMLGQQVAVLVNEHQPPGSYQAAFDGSNLASGIYLYKLTVQTNAGRIYADTKKLTLIK